jgi:hypothetical protein
MARPTKMGIEYFPLDVDIDQDDKIMLIEAAHGIAGFGIVIKLLMKIYKEGYFYEWTEKEQLLFSGRVNVDINAVNVIINDCLKWGLFHNSLYDKYKILTSAGIQRRYFAACTRRKVVNAIKPYILIDLSDFKNVVYVDINAVNVCINTHPSGVNADICTQSKVKESIVKESIGGQKKNSPQKYLDFVLLSKTEHKNLLQKIGKENTEEYIQRLNSYAHQNPKRFKQYKSHYHTILNWYRQDKQKEASSSGKRRISRQDDRDWEGLLGID